MTGISDETFSDWGLFGGGGQSWSGRLLLSATPDQIKASAEERAEEIVRDIDFRDFERELAYQAQRIYRVDHDQVITEKMTVADIRTIWDWVTSTRYNRCCEE